MTNQQTTSAPCLQTVIPLVSNRGYEPRRDRLGGRTIRGRRLLFQSAKRDSDCSVGNDRQGRCGPFCGRCWLRQCLSKEARTSWSQNCLAMANRWLRKSAVRICDVLALARYKATQARSPTSRSSQEQAYVVATRASSLRRHVPEGSHVDRRGITLSRMSQDRKLQLLLRTSSRRYCGGEQVQDTLQEGTSVRRRQSCFRQGCWNRSSAVQAPMYHLSKRRCA